MSYNKELHIALLSVQRACLLTQRVFASTQKSTLTKSDASPVTIGDFGAQALIISSLRHAFPNDAIVAEEEASSLRTNPNLADEIFDLVRTTHLQDAQAEKELGGQVASKEDMLTFIDSGGDAGGGEKGSRVWALDPIDGTKGFLRGEQYAVALGLIEEGDVKVGVLGCPNLPVSVAAADEPGGRGVLFSAAKGMGATSRALGGHGAQVHATKLQMKTVDHLKDATFVESVEAGHSSHPHQRAIADRLGIVTLSVRMDSQAKYGSIARGAGDLYLRLPVKKGYEEKIWDHAAGDLIVREAGGEVTDANGKPLDFSKGRTLKCNEGVVAAPKEVHGRVLEAVKAVLEGR